MNIGETFSQFPATTIIILAIVGIIAGVVRGFAGFGSGLILMPVASALINPQLAVAVFLATDFVASSPLIPAAMRRCDWASVLPTSAAALVFIPAGVFALVHSDPVMVRWVISILTILMLALLISGWRYPGRPYFVASLGVGAASGFLSGISQIAGPPIVTYWMSGPFPVATIRANLIVFFLFTSIGSFLAYFFNGLFTPAAIAITLVLMPLYAGAIWVGARLNGRASETTFRTIAYGLIAIAALTSLPALDGLFRG
ncbi:hypothetical protein MNBD_ALPHA12-1161 [hydrothermal vent metagenome]|uniref:Membrane transporter protein n=1 Tax=hydrothermal vent metagenome TaxID=652676 RepID=A0A3B0THQ6_9ZZZZ